MDFTLHVSVSLSNRSKDNTPLKTMQQRQKQTLEGACTTWQMLRAVDTLFLQSFSPAINPYKAEMWKENLTD